MSDIFKKDREAIRDLESLKDFCNKYIFEIASGTVSLTNRDPRISVRFLDFDGKFSSIGLGHFFFIDDCMYLITTDERYRRDHNPDILDFNEATELLRKKNKYVVRVLFAGMYTGFIDDKGKRIYTGDLVKAEIITNPQIPSTGKFERARDKDAIHGSEITAGVRDFFGQYVLLLDNHFAPLSWAINLEVVGNFFFDIDRNTTEIDIEESCSSYVFSRNPKEILEGAKNAPIFLYSENYIEKPDYDRMWDEFNQFCSEKIKENPWTNVIKRANKLDQYYCKDECFVCDDDKELIEKYNASVSEEYRFVTDILPETLRGNLLEAKIIILTLNPGFKEEINHTLYESFDRFSQCFVVDDCIAAYELRSASLVSGEPVNKIDGGYWSAKTQNLREDCGIDLKDIALMQYIPYHSPQFKYKAILKQLKSLEYTKLIIEFISQNRKDDYCYVIARNEKLWTEILEEFYSEDEYKKRVTSLKNPRNSAVTKNNLLDWEIIERVCNSF